MCVLYVCYNALQDSSQSLYAERQQLRVGYQQAVEQMLVQMRATAALHARAQDRIQRAADNAAQTDISSMSEKLPLLRHVTGARDACLNALRYFNASNDMLTSCSFSFPAYANLQLIPFEKAFDVVKQLSPRLQARYRLVMP